MPSSTSIRWEKGTKDRNEGSGRSYAEPGCEVDRAPTPHCRSLRSGEIKCRIAAFSPGTSDFFFIPFFLIELGSEMFSRKLFMCPYFKGTLLCERNEGREKVNIKTNLTWDEFFLRLKKCLLLFPSLLSFQLYVIKVPFLTQYFQMIQNSGDPADVWL